MNEVISISKSMGFLRAELRDKISLFSWVTPCEFQLEKTMENELKYNLKNSVKIGGFFWVKPGKKEHKFVHPIEKISYSRNVINANLRADGRDETNSFLPDYGEIEHTIKTIFNNGYLPIFFKSASTYEHDFTNTNTVEVQIKSDEKNADLFMPISLETNSQFIMPKFMLTPEFTSADLLLHA